MKGFLTGALFLLVWQAAYAVRLAFGADPLLNSLLGIGGHFIFETAAETLKLFFHFIHTFATSLSSSSEVACSFTARFFSESTLRA